MSTGSWGQISCGDKQQEWGFTVCSRAPPFMRSPNDPIDHRSRLSHPICIHPVTPEECIFLVWVHVCTSKVKDLPEEK